MANEASTISLSSSEKKFNLESMDLEGKLAEKSFQFQNPSKIGKRLHRCRGRGKRRAKKESRRRVRPGKSRSRGFVSMGAPFNNNDFLISQRHQRDYAGERLSVCDHSVSCGETSNILPQNVNSYHSENVGLSIDGTEHLETLSGLESERSDGNAESSEYGSSPSEEDSNSIDYYSDEIFDEEFETKNFEVDYYAQQQVLREEFLKMPRHELEDRYFSLVEVLKELEEKREERRQVNDLELQIRELTEENMELRRGLMQAAQHVHID